MRRNFPIPEYLEVRGNHYLSVHNALDPSRKGLPWGLLLSEFRQGRHCIKSISFVPFESIKLPQAEARFPIPHPSQGSALEHYFQTSDFELSAQNVHELIGKTARELLTGHILAVRYQPFLKPVPPGTRPDIKANPSWDFKFNSIATETTLTRYTADSYKLLTEWLESSPAQVLAALEGVSVVTIRNRLHSAREQGLLEKPGSGKRSAKKS